MWAASDHHRLFHLRESPFQVKIILQTVKRQDAIKIAPRQVSGQAGRSTTRGNEQAIIAKAAPSRKTHIFTRSANFLNVSIDDMNRLSALGPCRISKQLFACQFA